MFSNKNRGHSVFGYGSGRPDFHLKWLPYEFQESFWLSYDSTDRIQHIGRYIVIVQK